MSLVSGVSRTLAIALLIAPIMASCALFEPVAPLDIAGGHLERISISGDTIVSVGDTIRLSATGAVDGLIGLLSYDPLRDARWSSSSSATAPVMPTPANASDTLASYILVRGVRPGRVTIEATARGITGTHIVVVTRVSARPSFSP
jgi:hypothetical protein